MGQGPTLKRRFHGQVLRGFHLNVCFLNKIHQISAQNIFFTFVCLKVFSGSTRHGARGNLMGNLIFRDEFVLYDSFSVEPFVWVSKTHESESGQMRLKKVK